MADGELDARGLKILKDPETFKTPPQSHLGEDERHGDGELGARGGAEVLQRLYVAHLEM